MEKEPLYRLVTITDKFDFSLLEDEKEYTFNWCCYARQPNIDIRADKQSGKYIKRLSKIIIEHNYFHSIYLPHQEEKPERFDPVAFVPPFRLGRKQKRAILDSKGKEVVIFPENSGRQAKLYVKYLNNSISASPSIEVSKYEKDWGELGKIANPEKWLKMYEHYSEMLTIEDAKEFVSNIPKKSLSSITGEDSSLEEQEVEHNVTIVGMFMEHCKENGHKIPEKHFNSFFNV